MRVPLSITTGSVAPRSAPQSNRARRPLRAADRRLTEVRHGIPDAGGLVICNGYKDAKYIETALLAQKFDKTVIVVLERLEELDVVFNASEKLDIRPILGVRAKLTAKGVGRWAESAGDRAKFGLSTAEIVEDLPATKQFYRDVFELEVVFEDRTRERGHWKQYS